MGSTLKITKGRWNIIRVAFPWIAVFICLFLVRLSKGFLVADAYAILSRPFWPGPAQREWIMSSTDLERRVKIKLLEEDNYRLRGLLKLSQDGVKSGNIGAAVISRSPQGWWQQLELGKGSLNGIRSDDPVFGPGGLVGRVQSVTPVTSRVRLLTAPGSEVGVWLPRSGRHGLLIGLGSSRPQLRFIEKNPDVLPGDLVTTSPASTLLPPNLPVGVIQTIDFKAFPAPYASVQLIAAPEAIDWVQVHIN